MTETVSLAKYPRCPHPAAESDGAPTPLHGGRPSESDSGATPTSACPAPGKTHSCKTLVDSDGGCDSAHNVPFISNVDSRDSTTPSPEECGSASLVVVAPACEVVVAQAGGEARPSPVGATNALGGLAASASTASSKAGTAAAPSSAAPPLRPPASIDAALDDFAPVMLGAKAGAPALATRARTAGMPAMTASATPFYPQAAPPVFGYAAQMAPAFETDRRRPFHGSLPLPLPLSAGGVVSASRGLAAAQRRGTPSATAAPWVPPPPAAGEGGGEGMAWPPLMEPRVSPFPPSFLPPPPPPPPPPRSATPAAAPSPAPTSGAPAVSALDPDAQPWLPPWLASSLPPWTPAAHPHLPKSAPRAPVTVDAAAAAAAVTLSSPALSTTRGRAVAPASLESLCPSGAQSTEEVAGLRAGVGGGGGARTSSRLRPPPALALCHRHNPYKGSVDYVESTGHSPSQLTAALIPTMGFVSRMEGRSSSAASLHGGSAAALSQPSGSPHMGSPARTGSYESTGSFSGCPSHYRDPLLRVAERRRQQEQLRQQQQQQQEEGERQEQLPHGQTSEGTALQTPLSQPCEGGAVAARSLNLAASVSSSSGSGLSGEAESSSLRPMSYLEALRQSKQHQRPPPLPRRASDVAAAPTAATAAAPAVATTPTKASATLGRNAKPADNCPPPLLGESPVAERRVRYL